MILSQLYGHNETKNIYDSGTVTFIIGSKEKDKIFNVGNKDSLIETLASERSMA
jgi:hypothetical protein